MTPLFHRRRDQFCWLSSLIFIFNSSELIHQQGLWLNSLNRALLSEIDLYGLNVSLGLYGKLEFALTRVPLQTQLRYSKPH